MGDNTEIHKATKQHQWIVHLILLLVPKGLEHFFVQLTSSCVPRTSDSGCGLLTLLVESVAEEIITEMLKKNPSMSFLKQ